MPRSKSPFRASSDSKIKPAVVLTPTDETRIKLLARWYSLTPEAIARYELDESLWAPTSSHAHTEEAIETFRAHRRAVRRRFTRLKNIESNPANNNGPLVDSALVRDGLSAWYATRIGGTASDSPWPLRSAINTMVAPHAWMAADIGMRLEAHGYQVLSERELSTGINQHGDAIQARMDSIYRSTGGATTAKRPDVAVLAPNQRDYIAIEAERRLSRSVKVYEEKLTAYRDNPAIKAVWYLCAHRSTAQRVISAAETVLGQASQFPLRVIVLEQRDGFHYLDVPHLPVAMKGDLDAMGATQTETHA